MVVIMRKFIKYQPDGTAISKWKRPKHLKYQPYWITLVHMILGGQRVQIVGSMTIDGMSWKPSKRIVCFLHSFFEKIFTFFFKLE